MFVPQRDAARRKDLKRSAEPVPMSEADDEMDRIMARHLETGLANASSLLMLEQVGVRRPWGARGTWFSFRDDQINTESRAHARTQLHACTCTYTRTGARAHTHMQS